MFKTVIIVIAYSLLIWLPATLTAENVINKFAETLQANTKSSLKTCQSETGATRADLESLKARKMPQTKSGRCFLQCLFNTVKLMDEGKFSKQGMIVAFAPAMKGDLRKMGKLRKLSEVCQEEIGGRKFENCDGAKKIVECVARNGPAYGIEFSHDKKIIK